MISIYFLFLHFLFLHFLFLYFLNFVQFSFTNAYITTNQWTTINRVLSNKQSCTPQQLDTVYKLIYSHYEKWSFHKAYQFKRIHYYKCKEIPQLELTLYASVALNKAIANYNPLKCNNFAKYASYYITSELYKGMTTLQPITILTKYERRKSIYTKKEHDVMPTLFIGDDNYLVDAYKRPNEPPINEKQYLFVWTTLFESDIPAFTKHIISKQYSFDFKKVKSNKEIADLYGYSEEYIRKQLASSKQALLHAFRTSLD